MTATIYKTQYIVSAPQMNMKTNQLSNGLRSEVKTQLEEQTFYENSFVYSKEYLMLALMRVMNWLTTRSMFSRLFLLTIRFNFCCFYFCLAVQSYLIDS